MKHTVFKILNSMLVIPALLVGTAGMAACSNSPAINQQQVQANLSTVDEIYPAQNLNSIEKSDNVNGVRFTLTLEEYTEKFNKIKRSLGEDDLIPKDGWKQKSDVKADENHVSLCYYYYNGDTYNLTATVEVESKKLVNVGLGTTISNFMSDEGNAEASNKTLENAAIMAEAVCQFPTGSESFLENVFYRVTTDSGDSVWYQGFVFSLSTQENKTDSKSSIMLYRVFPVSDELKEEWELVEYENFQN